MRRGKGLYLGAFCSSERRYGGIALKQNGSRRRFLVLRVVLNAMEGRHSARWIRVLLERTDLKGTPT